MKKSLTILFKRGRRRMLPHEVMWDDTIDRLCAEAELPVDNNPAVYNRSMYPPSKMSPKIGINGYVYYWDGFIIGDHVTHSKGSVIELSDLIFAFVSDCAEKARFRKMWEIWELENA